MGFIFVCIYILLNPFPNFFFFATCTNEKIIDEGEKKSLTRREKLGGKIFSTDIIIGVAAFSPLLFCFRQKSDLIGLFRFLCAFSF